MNKVAAIAGAGPAGLTAALELLKRSKITPVVFEADTQVGGISKTVQYRGNRMDLGGHRFFSKSDWVMRWWQEILPVAGHNLDAISPLRLRYQQQSRDLFPIASRPESSDAVMLVRERLSRILYRRRLFDYPLKLNANTLTNLGAAEIARIGFSYAKARIRPRDAEKSLKDFLINRFGERLYLTFFKDYTEKVWGVPCENISAEWGAQRIKGLSITKALSHALTGPLRALAGSFEKSVETSLIEHFLYPKFGPGQLWEEVARRVGAGGGEVHLNHRVVAIEREANRVTAVRVLDERTGSARRIPCDFLISTMPVSDLTQMLMPEDSRVMHIAEHLPYRDFITVGLLLKKMIAINSSSHGTTSFGMPPDNWIYVQERDVKIGRLQIFNNWSPNMVADAGTVWLGLEYFCQRGDELWSMSDAEFISFAAGEVEKIGLIRREDILDGTVVRVPRAYPAYFGEYAQFGVVRQYLDQIPNLYPIGRNGMHRYNNQDHSMLAADAAVSSILDPNSAKSSIWSVNAEHEYHEAMKSG